MYYNNFNCNKCQYITCSKYDFDIHISTLSHLYIIDIPEPSFNCICGNKYKFENAFYRHTKICEILTHSDNKNHFLLFYSYLKKYLKKKFKKIFKKIKITP